MAVLIKGKSIRGTQKSRDHYLRGPENERITVREVIGFATKDAEEALRMLELSAKGSKCKKPVYSAKINPETDRIWNKNEIRRAVELLEENLGLKNYPRVVVEHKKHGRIHFHVLWGRIPPDGGSAVRMSNDYAVHQKIQKQLEKEFKLRPMMAKGRDFKQSEVEWAKRYGFDIFKLREQITADFNKGTSGQEFMVALKDRGTVLCRGDKSQFVLILPWGQHKALSSMIHGRPTKAVLRRSFADIDISELPTVTEGKARIKATLPKAEQRAKSGTKGKSGHALYIGSKSSQTTVSHAAKRLIASYQPRATLSSLTRAVVLTAPASAESRSAQQQQVTFPHPTTAPERKFISNREEVGGDETPSGRAELAYKEEFDKWQGLIEAAANDQSVPKHQRRANVAALRIQQQAAAKGARKRVLEEEKSVARAARRARRILLGLSIGQ